MVIHFLKWLIYFYERPNVFSSVFLSVYFSILYTPVKNVLIDLCQFYYPFFEFLYCLTLSLLVTVKLINLKKTSRVEFLHYYLEKDRLVAHCHISESMLLHTQFLLSY